MITDYRPWRDLTGYVYHCDGGWLKTENIYTGNENINNENRI